MSVKKDRSAGSFCSYFFLLLAPDVHYELVGKELCEKHLNSNRESAYRNVLALFHVAKGTLYDLGRFKILVVVADGVVLYCVVEELGLYPSWTYSHNSYSAVFQFYVQRARKTEYEGLGCSVKSDVRNGLEGRKRSELIYAGSRFHKRKGLVGHLCKDS